MQASTWTRSSIAVSRCGVGRSRRRRPGLLVGGLVASLILTACGSAGQVSAAPSGGESSSVSAASSASAAPAPTSDSTADMRSTAATTCTNKSALAQWSTRRLGMLTIVVPAAESSVGSVETEVAAGVGGVLLFGSSAPASLGRQLAALESHVPGKRGLLVMTDEEGGGVQRMANLVGSLPWAAWMGKNWTATQIRSHLGKVAAKMSAAHVNMDLAPVLDVDGRNQPPSRSNPDGWRSFSGHTSVVTRDAQAYLAGLHDGHVIGVLKHFPGIGHSTYNSDDGTAYTLPWSTLKKVGLPPFTAAIAAGAPAIMVSNDVVRGLATNPGSISPTTISYELRGKLGFRGLVITDSLTAKAISDAGFTLPRAAVQALRSGADMITFGGTTNVGPRTAAIADAIVAAVSDGSLSRGRLIDAAAHVLAVRHVSLCG
jgi:beta-N-acetylhexosaminidase